MNKTETINQEINNKNTFISNLKKAIQDREVVMIGGGEFEGDELLTLTTMLQDGLQPINKTAVDYGTVKTILANVKHAVYNRETVHVGGGDFQNLEMREVLKVLEKYQSRMPERQEELLSQLAGNYEDRHAIDYSLKIAAHLQSAFAKSQESIKYSQMVKYHDPIWNDGNLLQMALNIDLQMSVARKPAGAWDRKIKDKVIDRWESIMPAFIDREATYARVGAPSKSGLALAECYRASQQAFENKPEKEQVKELSYLVAELSSGLEFAAFDLWNVPPYQAALAYLAKRVNTIEHPNLDNDVKNTSPAKAAELMRDMSDITTTKMSRLMSKWQTYIGLYDLQVVDGSQRHNYDAIVVAEAVLHYSEKRLAVPVNLVGVPLQDRIFNRQVVDISEMDPNFLNTINQIKEAQLTQQPTNKKPLSKSDILVIAAKLETIRNHLSVSLFQHSEITQEQNSEDTLNRFSHSKSNLQHASNALRQFVAKQLTPSKFGKTYNDIEALFKPTTSVFMVHYNPADDASIRERAQQQERTFFTNTRPIEGLDFEVQLDGYSRAVLPRTDRVYASEAEAMTFAHVLSEKVFGTPMDENFEVKPVTLSPEQLSSTTISTAPKMDALLWVMNNTGNQYKELPLDNQLRIYADMMGVYVPQALYKQLGEEPKYTDITLELPALLNSIKKNSPETYSDIINSVNYNGEYSERPQITPRQDDGEHLTVSAPRLTR